MVNPALCQFTNQHSVRFTLDSFALPVTGTKQKNKIYTKHLSGLRGTKQQLLPAVAPVDLHGYDMLTRWGNWLFAANQDGLYYAERDILQFRMLDGTVNPRQLCAVCDRLFLISADRRRIVYSVDLTTSWLASEGKFLSGSIFLPDNYGLCLDILPYQANLLVICEYGLLVIKRNLSLNHLADDSEVLKTNLAKNATEQWESDWFSLGYATDTQTLREVLIKTQTDLTLVVKSNRTQRNLHVAAKDGVQKIKVNLGGDQFQLAIYPSQGNVCITDLAAVVVYGKKG